MRPSSNPSVDKKKKDRERRAVKDDFYDRINYYESRNIFSSNEPFNPSNRLYTDQAALSHPVWSTIGQSNVPFTNPIHKKDMEKEKEASAMNRDLTQSLLNSINKMNTVYTSAPIGCKKCGYVGHLAFQCRNDVKLKSKFDSIDIKPSEEFLESLGKNVNEQHSKTKSEENNESHRKKEKKEKKEKKSKKDKKDKKDKKLRKDKKDKKLSDEKKEERSKSNSRSRKRRSRSRSRTLSREKYSKK